MSKKYLVGIVVVGLLALAGGASASGWVISNIKQIKPSVRHQLRGNNGPQGPAGAAGVVPQIVLVQSPQITLQDGQDSYQVEPNGFQATCPAGDVVLGTGFNGPFPSTGGFVQNYGTFVGGFFANDNGAGIPVTVYLQASCGQVPSGYTGSVRYHSTGGAEAAYHAALQAAQAKR